jgi:hypothetical protein
VTLAVLCESTGNDLGPESSRGLADSLAAALTSAGASRVVRVEGPDTAGQLREIARIAAGSDEAVLLCADDLVAHPGLLWTLATEPGGRSTALVAATDGGGDLREERGRLVPADDGTTRFLGAMMISAADLGLIEAAARRPVGAEAGAVDALLPALLGVGLVPIATRVRLLHAERVRTEAQLGGAVATVAAIDEDKALLRLAVKERDDFFATYFVSSWSPLVTRLCARAGLSPGAVTWLSVLLAVLAAGSFWQASRAGLVVGAVLLYLGVVLDCVDGQLARYTRRFGAFGGWLGTMAGRAKEYAVYAGLAAGAERMGLSFAWPLAIAAITLQTVRDMADTWYGALHDEAAARQAVGTAGNPDTGGGVGARLSRASSRVRSDAGSIAYWLKRIVVFPIGERWALIAIAAACFDARVALAAVVTGGALALAYTTGLRSLRSISMRVAVLDKVETARHRDDGRFVRGWVSAAGLGRPLLWAGATALLELLVIGGVAVGIVPRGGSWTLGPVELNPVGAAGYWLVPLLLVALIGGGAAARAAHDGPLDWLVPAVLRAVEYLLVIAVGMSCDVPPAVLFALLFALALNHYDLAARLNHHDLTARRERSGSYARLPVLGWDGRLVLLVFFAVAGVATLGEALIAVAMGWSFVRGAVKAWRR